MSVNGKQSISIFNLTENRDLGNDETCKKKKTSKTQIPKIKMNFKEEVFISCNKFGSLMIVTMADLVPQEIWENHIFTKIPVDRFLLGWKFVCKSWNNILSDPKFSHIFDLHHHVVVRIHKDCSSRSIVYDSNTAAWTHIRSVARVNQQNIKYVIGSSNRSLCCAVFHDTKWSYQVEKLAIWNLTTGVFKFIPDCSGFGFGFKFRDTLYFGFDGEKVVCIKPWLKKLQVYIYSTKSDSWETKEGEGGCYAHYFPKHEYGFAQENYKACGMNGSIYWITCVEIETCEKVIVFSIKDVKFRAVDMPCGWSSYQCSYTINMTTMGGRLGVSQIESSRRLRIWTLNEAGCKEQWSKLIDIDIPTYRLLRPVCLTRDQKIVLSYQRSILRHNKEEIMIMLYDPMTGKVQDLDIDEEYKQGFTTLAYVDRVADSHNLISSPWQHFNSVNFSTSL